MRVGTRFTIGFILVVVLIWVVAGLCIKSYGNIHTAFEVARAEQKALRSEELPASFANIHRAHQAGVRAILLAAALTTTLAAVAVFVITRSIVRPLGALSRGAERIDRGELDVNVGTSAADEIGHLSRTFDGMPPSLRTTATFVDRLKREIDRRKHVEEELRSHREHLEELVEERTRELKNEIADRERADAERAEMQAQLYRAHKLEAIGLLAGGIAHDFNNLLSTVQGYTDLALMQAGEGSRLSRYLKHIQEAGSRGANLTKQLLIFSRKHPVEATRIDLNSVLRDMLDMLDRIIREDIEINADFDTDLWSIQGDKTNIEQVVMNLMLNARDAMPNGGEISLTTENVTLNEGECRGRPDAKAGRYVCLAVADQGVGIDEAIIHHIFDPFFTTKEMEQGTGLGLAVAHGIVEYHSGWIDVDSKMGQGSVFKVYLPALTCAPEAGPQDAPGGADCRGNGERILVVEDAKEVREVISKMLAENGYVVDEAASSREAVSVFERNSGNFDMLLSDMVLPDEDAVHLADRLLAVKPDLGVLLISGYLDERSMAPVIRARGFAFMRKPITLSNLLGTVRKVIASAGAKAKESIPLPQ